MKVIGKYERMDYLIICLTARNVIGILVCQLRNLTEVKLEQNLKTRIGGV